MTALSPRNTVLGGLRSILSRTVALAALGSMGTAVACTGDVARFVRVPGPRIALTHVTVVDGTGSPIREDQTILIQDSRIAAVGPASAIATPADTEVLDLRGRTVIPGLVGMHDHLFYATHGGRSYVSLPHSFSHLYLGSGVTTIRTAGPLELWKDAAIKRAIDAGREAGPSIQLTAPYLHAGDPAILERAVNDAADEGLRHLKAYTDIRREELAAAITAAHKRGMLITGHLCAVGFREAAALGIDNLEHGLLVDTEFYSLKRPGVCPPQALTLSELVNMDVEDPRIQETIRQLVGHGVAVTSTLAIWDTFAGSPAYYDTLGRLLTADAFREYGSIRQAIVDSTSRALWRRALLLEMQFERSFVRAGGRLLAGADPTGWGGMVAGLADLRGLELLAEAGFTPEETIQIASANGAAFLGDSTIGTVEPGKQADLVVLRGDLRRAMQNVRNVEVVFKKGIGFDAASLMRADEGRIGADGEGGDVDWRSWRIWTGPAIAGGLLLIVVAIKLVRRPARPPRGR